MSDYERIAQIIEFLAHNQTTQPSLDELASVVDLSPHHVQRLFTRYAGVSPKKFLQCLTAEHAKRQLRSGRSVLQSAFDVGLSGPSRLHDLTVMLDSASPGEIRSGGQGWSIQMGVIQSPFGKCFLAESPRGICRLEFIDSTSPESCEASLQQEWPNATLKWNNRSIKQYESKIFGRRKQPSTGETMLQCIVGGTPFQVRVWKALLKLPVGEFVSYGDIAAKIEQPTASRAVGTAIGRNPIAYLIPCHRVIRSTGVIGDYRWGTTRKKILIATESAWNQQPTKSR